jgi:DNA anti-recombination protein RmuC
LVPETPPLLLSAAESEILQSYILQRFKTLELHLTLEQQRHRNQMEEALHTLQQQFTAALREQHQQQHLAATTIHDLLEQMRKEFSDTLQYFSQDISQRLRQAEEHTKRALDNLWEEVQRLFSEREQVSGRRPLPAAYPSTTENLTPAAQLEQRL